MRQRVIEARDRGIYVSIMLFDGWTVENKYSGMDVWNGHPYNLNNNINNIDGDVNNNGQGEELHILTDAQVTILQVAYVKKVIDTVNDLDNVLYEISNESPGDNPTTPEMDSSKNWQYYMIQIIKGYEAAKPKQHPVGMTFEWLYGNNTYLYESPADWISLGGDVNLETYVPSITTGSSSSKVILADTDHLCGICGSQQWVWKSFTSGENPIFMDIYDNAVSGRGAPFSNPNEVEVRRSMGYTRRFATRMNLTTMAPQPTLCSTSFCLASTDSIPAEFLVYLPSGGSVTVNLSSFPGLLTYEWFNPTTGVIVPGGSVAGGNSRFFNAPFSGDAVLFIYSAFAGMSPSQPGTPSVTLAFPTLVADPAASPTSTPVPSGSGPSRTLLLVLSGIFLFVLLAGGLFWMFKRGNRSA